MWSDWAPFKGTKYELVTATDPKDYENASAPFTENGARRPRREPVSFTTWTSICLLGWIAAGALGFFAGRHLPELFAADFLPAPAGMVKQVWLYNRTFSDPPSAESDAAWMSIFPRGRGFFSHPSLTVNISGVAVFHELHCLSGIRNAYYEALNPSNASHAQDQFTGRAVLDDAKIDAANRHNDPHHIRHCFDYLRQALMCAADTNLEVIDWPLGGSTGWGFERQCRDYSEVVAWVEKWRYHSQTTIA